jgi:hypothetical protein
MGYRFPHGALTLLLFTGPGVGTLRAQVPGVQFRVGAYGVLGVRTLDPIPGGGRKTEFRVEQPMVSLAGNALDGRLLFSSSVSFEKASGEAAALGVGAWGGAFYDRTPSHAWLHEGVVALVGSVGEGGGGGHDAIAAGKGIVPFGSDPPMMRPPVSPPVNQHWNEIMDRLLVSVSARLRGRFGLELSLFDEGPSVKGTAGQDSAGHTHGSGTSGVSSSARLTLWPVRGLEIRGSAASLLGGGHHAGAGSQRQWNLSVRLDQAAGGGRIGLLAEIGRVLADQSFKTMLAEAQWSSGDRRHRLYYRVERTDRPDGPRSSDGFRAVADTSGLPIGITRWTVQAAGYGIAFRPRWAVIEPVLEGSLGRARSVGGTPVDLERLYGRRSHWSVLAGIRVTLGSAHSMGRYGAFGVGAAEHEGHEGHASP